MNHRNILDTWVAYLFEEWLDKRGQPQLHPSVEPLIRRLRQYAPDPNHKDDAWHCIEQLEKLYDQVHRESYRMSARMFLECGVAAYQMGNAHEALSYLTRATSSSTEDHDKGIAHWLLGCVYWYMNNPVNALASWENGYRHFKEQNLKSGRGAGLEAWYKDKIREMENAIKYGAEKESPPPPQRIAKSKRSAAQHLLRTLPVIGQIPAGTPLGILPSPVDFMNISRVCLNEKEYYFSSLTSGQKTVTTPQRDQYYYLLRVSGNSMNEATPEAIEDGDYVLLREQYTADNGDIVAALIVKDQELEQQPATLKRFVRRDGQILLLPESDDPEFQKPVYRQSFSNPNDEFQIRGVALAVLKPL